MEDNDNPLQKWLIVAGLMKFEIVHATGNLLLFHMNPGAPTGSFLIHVNGDVEMSDTSPEADLDIECGSFNHSYKILFQLTTIDSHVFTGNRKE